MKMMIRGMALSTTERGQQRRRTIMMVGLLTFLFHAIFPYYAAAMEEGVDGYTTTLCTASGYKTVFVAFDDAPAETAADASSYYECPTCIVHANASGWIDTYGAPLFEALLPQSERLRGSSSSLTPENQYYPPFLIRGPPA